MRISITVALALAMMSGAVWSADKTLADRVLVAPSQEATASQACGDIEQDPSGDQLAGRGCCSHHGGQCGCSGGHTQCCDGAQSPSCMCVKGDPEGSGV